MAGPNGAGKTTFATAFLPKFIGPISFVNPDLIAKGLSPFNTGGVAAKAGRLVLERIDELISKRDDFAFETTLSGKTYLHLLERLGDKGYRIRLFYLWVPTPELALARIAVRVRKGGHDVPEADVRRRMKRSLQNLFALYLPRVDALWLLDNSERGAQLVSVHAGTRKRVFNSTTLSAILSTDEA